MISKTTTPVYDEEEIDMHSVRGNCYGRFKGIRHLNKRLGLRVAARMRVRQKRVVRYDRRATEKKTKQKRNVNVILFPVSGILKRAKVK